MNASGISAGDVVKGGADHKWKVTQAGTYKITINFSTKKINVTVYRCIADDLTRQ